MPESGLNALSPRLEVKTFVPNADLGTVCLQVLQDIYCEFIAPWRDGMPMLAVDGLINFLRSVSYKLNVLPDH